MQYDNLRKRFKFYEGQVIVDALEQEEGHSGRAERVFTSVPPTTTAATPCRRRASVRRVTRRGSSLSALATVATAAGGMRRNRRTSAPMLLATSSSSSDVAILSPPARRRRSVSSEIAILSPPARQRRREPNDTFRELAHGPHPQVAAGPKLVADVLQPPETSPPVPSDGPSAPPAEGSGAAPAQTLSMLDRPANVAASIGDFLSSQHVRGVMQRKV